MGHSKIVTGFPPVWVTNEKKKYAGGKETTSKDILPHGRGGLWRRMPCSAQSLFYFYSVVPFDICGFYGKSQPDSLHSGDSARLRGQHTQASAYIVQTSYRLWVS